MKLIKPIETQYKGYRFRSRLEARWAVFFDILNIEWEYEKEGFDFAGVRYLPDFWLSTVNMWAEVKPDLPFDKAAKNLCIQLANQTGFEVLMLGGLPNNFPYPAITVDGHTYDGYQLSNFKNYPQLEHRFYAMPGGWENFDDTETACLFARSARFEYGEKP